MGRKWNPEGVPNDLLIPKGNLLFEIGEIEEAEVAGKLVYKPELTATEPKAYAGKKLFGITYWIGSDSDPDARDPETWAAARGAVELKKLIVKSGVKPSGDMDKDREAAMGRIVGIVVGKKTRKDGSREDNTAMDYFKAGERIVEIFDDAGKPVAVKAPKALAKPLAVAEDVDNDDDDDEEPTKQPPVRSTDAAQPKPGKPKKADTKQCPKCQVEFPRSEMLSHLATCGDDDDDD